MHRIGNHLTYSSKYYIFERKCAWNYTTLLYMWCLDLPGIPQNIKKKNNFYISVYASI